MPDDPWKEWRQEVAVIPPIPVQEAEAEAKRLKGAETVEAPAAPYSVPAETGISDEEKVTGVAGSSVQVASGPDVKSAAGSEKHEHYWIHTVTETIDRGFYDGEAHTIPLKDGDAYQVFGLDDLRVRATLIIAPKTTAEGTPSVPVYFGKRDVINGTAPETGLQLAAGSAIDVRSRNEWWVLYAPGDGSVLNLGVIQYKSEPTEGTLARQTTPGKPK
jgi:hypothetical protein